jgi:hypothetical protein
MFGEAMSNVDRLPAPPVAAFLFWAPEAGRG